eukprot:1806825-Rhodomonas_salina.2
MKQIHRQGNAVRESEYERLFQHRNQAGARGVPLNFSFGMRVELIFEHTRNRPGLGPGTPGGLLFFAACTIPEQGPTPGSSGVRRTCPGFVRSDPRWSTPHLERSAKRQTTGPPASGATEILVRFSRLARVSQPALRTAICVSPEQPGSTYEGLPVADGDTKPGENRGDERHSIHPGMIDRNRNVLRFELRFTDPFIFFQNSSVEQILHNQLVSKPSSSPQLAVKATKAPEWSTLNEKTIATSFGGRKHSLFQAVVWEALKPKDVENADLRALGSVLRAGVRLAAQMRRLYAWFYRGRASNERGSVIQDLPAEPHQTEALEAATSLHRGRLLIFDR